MFKRYSLLVLLIFLPILFLGCITKKIEPRLEEFSSSVLVAKDSVSEVFRKFQALEIETRSEESANRSSVKPSDFEPVVFTFKIVEERVEIANLLYLYALGIKNLFEGNNEILAEQLSGVGNGLKAIQLKFPKMLPEKKEGALFALLTAIPRGLSASKKRKFLIRTMREMQAVIQSLAGKLGNEINSSLLLSENYFRKIFRKRIEKKWPKKVNNRGKFARLAEKLIKKKYELRRICTHLGKALKMLPIAHKAIIDALILKSDAMDGITEFIAEISTIRSAYDNFRRGE